MNNVTIGKIEYISMRSSYDEKTVRETSLTHGITVWAAPRAAYINGYRPLSVWDNGEMVGELIRVNGEYIYNGQHCNLVEAIRGCDIQQGELRL